MIEVNQPIGVFIAPFHRLSGYQDDIWPRSPAGAQDQQVRLITVPAFCETSTIVLVDLKDLSCFPITIEV
ncbi:unnamed protein product [Peronospora belbahrii]|uniref:Uncharacterized protein n=1 Tax=Peronospora belbahrii TaxID=622444 RepID=A0ABN8D2P1_9STRA|nr:unnamed protein product [Peronospora belbahrii]